MFFPHKMGCQDGTRKLCERVRDDELGFGSGSNHFCSIGKAIAGFLTIFNSQFRGRHI